MTHPVLVLRRPERRGNQVALSADLLLGGKDHVTVSALVGPDTQRWIRGAGRKVLVGLAPRIMRAKRLLSRYMKVEGGGHWSDLGDLLPLSFDVARTAAASDRLSLPAAEILDAAEHYLALAGKRGEEALAEAQAIHEELERRVHAGDPWACRRRELLDVAHAMMCGEVPASDDALSVSRALDSIGGACCSACAEGKACAGDDEIEIPYDMQEAVLAPDVVADRVANLGADAIGYKSYQKVAPPQSMAQSVANVWGLVGRSSPWIDYSGSRGAPWIDYDAVSPVVGHRRRPDATAWR